MDPTRPLHPQLKVHDCLMSRFASGNAAAWIPSPSFCVRGFRPCNPPPGRGCDLSENRGFTSPKSKSDLGLRIEGQSKPEARLPFVKTAPPHLFECPTRRIPLPGGAGALGRGPERGGGATPAARATDGGWWRCRAKTAGPTHTPFLNDGGFL